MLQDVFAEVFILEDGGYLFVHKFAGNGEGCVTI